MLDLDAYLERIGLTGRPSLAQLHRAHLTSIPFENLDPHQGLPVSLEPGDLERKLVTERRGGYCFEQNLLLKAALEALGAAGGRVPGTGSRQPGAGRGSPTHSPRPPCQRERGELARRRGVWRARDLRADPIRAGARAGAVGLELSHRRRRLRVRAPEARGGRVGRSLRLSAEAGSVRRRRAKQLVDLHASALAVRHGPDRRHPRRRRLEHVAQRLERVVAQGGNAGGHECDAARERGHTGAACHALLAPRLCARRRPAPRPGGG